MRNGVVVREETVVVRRRETFEGRVSQCGGIVGILQHDEAPLLEVLANRCGLPVEMRGSSKRAAE